MTASSTHILSPGKRVFMFILGFASGLPYAIFTGTIIAWLADFGIDTKTIGVLSWAGLMYAFKFLWSPMISTLNIGSVIPGMKMGRLRLWMFYCQLAIIAAIVCVSMLDATASVPIVALLAVIATFASATQDVAIAAWRIRAAETNAMLDAISTTEQFGYRISAFIGGAGVLIYADAVSWGAAWIFVAIAMAACFATLFFIPDVKDNVDEGDGPTITLAASLPGDRGKYVWPVVATWSICLIILFSFMAYILLAENAPSTRYFTLTAGPLIVAACVGAPVLASILILNKVSNPTAGTARAASLTDTFYITLLEPMLDLVYRLRYSAILVLLLVLTYRFTDTIWGSFAYPFYLGGPETGGLGYSLTEVAIASKTFGVIMTITGTAVAGFAMALIGRLPSLVIGGIVAAATNLLYADLALGGVRIDAFIHMVNIDALYPAINSIINWLATTPIISEAPPMDDRLGRLITVIAGENLAVGFASVVYVVYLSSIVNKKYAAVQYSLLASLTMLLGVMGRGYLGELILEHGYAFVFIITALMGGVGILASIAEWYRQTKMKPA